MNHRDRPCVDLIRAADRASSSRRGFTLVELLVSISIISLLASMILVALAGVQETSRADRTRSQIGRIDALITEKWESYRNRRVPVPPQALIAVGNQPPRVDPISQLRVNAIREIMRMELPDRKTDLLFGTSTPQMAAPSLWLAYRRKAAQLIGARQNANLQSIDVRDDRNPSFSVFEDWLNQNWSDDFQAAECLYLILSQMVDQESSALEFFRDREVGDLDRDGMPEILDGWGQPIFFVRWAPGLQLPGSPQDGEAPDPFDLTGVYRRPPFNLPSYALYPFISSAGPDKLQGFFHSDPTNPLVYATTSPPNNPFVNVPSPSQPSPSDPAVGTAQDSNGDQINDLMDNITNHTLAAS